MTSNTQIILKLEIFFRGWLALKYYCNSSRTRSKEVSQINVTRADNRKLIWRETGSANIFGWNYWRISKFRRKICFYELEKLSSGNWDNGWQPKMTKWRKNRKSIYPSILWQIASKFRRLIKFFDDVDQLKEPVCRRLVLRSIRYRPKSETVLSQELRQSGSKVQRQIRDIWQRRARWKCVQIIAAITDTVVNGITGALCHIGTILQSCANFRLSVVGCRHI